MRKTMVLMVVIVAVAGAGAAIWVSHLSSATKPAAMHSIAQAETTLPGTGITMVLPEGIIPSPLGTMYSDEGRKTLLAISVGLVKHNTANDPMMQALYPEPVEELRNGHVSGKIFKRTRAKNGGTWDGWWLNVVKGDRVLDVKISYSGSNDGEFEKLKDYLSTGKWDGNLGDPEQAFGLRLDIPGMKLAHPGLGALLYTADGQPEWEQPNLFLMAVPGFATGDMDAFHKVCEAAAAKMMAGTAYSPVRYQAERGVNVCDVSGQTSRFGQGYSAVVMMPEGGVFAATGTGDPQAFQRALLEPHLIDR